MPKIPIKSTFYSKFTRTNVSLLCSQFSHCPILRQMNPRYILLHIYFGSISIFFYSHKISYVTYPTMIFWREFWMGTSTLTYVSQMPHISASLILPPTNYRVHIFWWSSFCNFLELPLISSNLQPIIFSNNSKICDTLTVKDEVLFKNSTKVTLEIFSHTQQYAGWFVNCRHFCRIWVKLSSVMVPNF